jgi:hypothetical protein
MRRIASRFFVLVVLAVALIWVGNDAIPVHASSCWSTAVSTWMGCDNAYSGTQNDHFYAPTTCAASAASACPNDVPCYTAHYNACIAADQTNYNNRGDAYSSCIGVEGNAGYCIENIEDIHCELAFNRVQWCASIYCPNGTVCEPGWLECLAASGAWMCI